MKKNYIVIALITIVTALAYSPVLFNFFCGDDFVHLDWLSKAIDHPAMLLHNFNHNWLDIPTFKFYRPLISVFMYTDYLVWRVNGFGFHLTNVLFHIANSILVFAIASQLYKLSDDATTEEKAERAWTPVPFAPLAGLLFALYPLHCEAVSWITGRVDDIVATFFLASFCSYIHWREKRTTLSLSASLFSMALALTCKEMAVILPALLVALEIILPQRSEQQESILQKSKHAALSTLPFWILLALYFVVRRLALGTFVGGYDDSLFFIANMRDFLAGWRNGLMMLAQPANQLMIGSHNIGLIAWDAGALFAIVGIFKAIKDSRTKKLSLFLLAWVVLAFAPVYKIFSISIDLQSSRLAYLVTVPLSLLLAWGLAEGAALFDSKKKVPGQWIFLAASISFLFGAFFLLYKNNEPWRESGLELNAMRADLARVYEKIKGDPQTLLLGMPDQRKGAYEGRNAVPEMLQKPQFPRDLKNCIAFNSALPILPFGYLLDSLSESASESNVLLWDEVNRKWLDVEQPNTMTKKACWRLVLDQQAVQSLTKTNQSQNQQTINIENANHGCDDFLFVQIAQNPGSEMRGKLEEPTLTFSNDLTKTSRQPIKIKGNLLSLGDKTGFVFSMRTSPYWVFSQENTDLDISLPATVVVKSISSMSSNELMPAISFSNSGFLGTKGFTHLSRKDPRTTISCTKNDVTGAQTFALEILRPNLFLAPADQNSPEPARVQLRLLKSAARTGDIILDKKDFPGEGIYQARLFAVDSKGELIGVAGDHINISVEPD